MSKTSRDILFKGRKILDDAIRKESRDQGHYLTGGLERSLTATVTETKNFTQVEGYAAGYAGILNEGVEPSRIPYGGAKTGAKTSKYITGLYNFWRLRGLNEKEALRAAFATAKVHKKQQGMPTLASYKFSKNGRRLGLLSRAVANVNSKLDATIIGGFSAEIDKEFSKTKSETV